MKTNYMKNNWMHFTLALGLMGALATAAHAGEFFGGSAIRVRGRGQEFPGRRLHRRFDLGRRHYDPQCGFRGNGCDDGLARDIGGDPEAGHGLR